MKRTILAVILVVCALSTLSACSGSASAHPSKAEMENFAPTDLPPTGR